MASLVPPNAYNALMGLFRPQAAPAGASAYDQAMAQARSNALGQFGMGLVAAAIPQTAAQRVQSLQGAIGSLQPNMTDVYNQAQAKLMFQNMEDSAANRKAASAYLGTLINPQTASTPAAPMVAPVGEFRELPDAAKKLLSPPAPTATPPKSNLTNSQIAYLKTQQDLGADPTELAQKAAEFEFDNAQGKTQASVVALDDGTYKITQPNGQVVISANQNAAANFEINKPQIQQVQEKASMFIELQPTLDLAMDAVNNSQGGYSDIVKSAWSKVAPVFGVEADATPQAIIKAAQVQLAPLFKQAGSTSNYEMQLYFDAVLNLGDTKEANQLKLTLLNKLGQRANEMASLMTQNKYSDNLTGIVSNAFKDKPIFTEEETKLLQSAKAGKSTTTQPSQTQTYDTKGMQEFFGVQGME